MSGCSWSSSNKGCPEVKEEHIKQLNDYGEIIAVLDNMANVMKQFPTAKFAIEGHTDSSGSDKINDPLSWRQSKCSKRLFDLKRN
ncbi:hypothetical protein FQR65_LT20994 [Abscondita terminalis]|nr:hypothetical protein FQR65_LT20994 [Abscondita terminalis]